MISNIILYLIFSRLLVPKYNEKVYILIFINNIKFYSKYVLTILIILFIHLIEVNIIDKYITEWINLDFAYILQTIEGNFVYNFSNRSILYLLI